MISKSPRFPIALLALLLSAFTVIAQQAGAKKQPPASAIAATEASAGKVAPSSLLPVVLGEGATGTITKWTGNNLLNSTIGNSVMIEDAAGRIGIGTTTPGSKLSVRGMIETTLGGYKFPDGTVQTSAAMSGLQAVAHNVTLAGNGTPVSPLGIAPEAVGTIHLANQSVTAAKIANGTMVRSLNGLLDNVQLAAGANITITPSGSALMIAAPNSLSIVTHDATLGGNGTSGASLGVAIPLDLTASVPWFVSDQLLNVVNDGESGDGVRVVAGNGAVGGNAVVAWGGHGSSVSGGGGVLGVGGLSNTGAGGTGVGGHGGSSTSHFGGVGVQARGGGSGGTFGGDGIQTIGGAGSGAGKNGGHGILARGGVGEDGAVNGLAGNFQGSVLVTGNLSTGGGSFKIDHPLDPENKYLYHSFVESPDMKNIYDGTVTTDANGDATVSLPDYFEALNKDFRYQLTVIGTFAQAIVADEIKGNRFSIKTNAANVKVSWMVTGIRQDAYANKNRIRVEEEKPEPERGFYLHPETFNQPEERGVEWARHPEMMQQFKQRRIEGEPNRKPIPPHQR